MTGMTAMTIDTFFAKIVHVHIGGHGGEAFQSFGTGNRQLFFRL
jgi:hypothetical protein